MCLRRLCPCIGRKKRVENTDRALREEVSAIEFQTSVASDSEEWNDLYRPSEINLKLEVAIGKWEHSIQQYQAYENYLADGNVDGITKELIVSVRENPQKFTDSKDTHIAELARKRIQMMENQYKLGIHGTNVAIADASLETRQSSQHALTLLETIVPGGRNSAISARFADKLQEINQSRRSVVGSIISPMISPVVPPLNSAGASMNGLASVPLKIRPKWPDYLVDCAFDAFKINSVGKKLRRTIKLTEYHILNIKEDGTHISKVHKYLDVDQIWLENANTFKISMKDGLIVAYLSPIAAHIAHQITTRVQTRIALEKTVFSGPQLLFGSGPNRTVDRMMAAISAENRADTNTSMLSFANELGELTRQRAAKRAVTTLEEDERNVVVSSLHSGDRKSNDRTSDTSVPSQKGSISSSSSTVKTTPRLFSAQIGMGEYRVQSEVMSILCDSSSPECSTKQQFLDTFEKKGKTLEDIRYFIEGLHEYILSNRGLHLADLLFNEPPPPSATSNTAATTALFSSSLLSPSKFMGDNTSAARGRAASAGSHSASTGKPAGTLNRPQSFSFNSSSTDEGPEREASVGSITDLHALDESSLAALSFIVFKVVEESVFLSLRDKISALLPSSTSNASELLFVKKMKYFSNRSQDAWGIAPDLISPLGWQNAVFELSFLEKQLTPSMQLLTLSKAMKAVYAEFKLVVLPKLKIEGKKDVFIGADDLVPIFLHVFCQCEMKHPIRNREQMWALCHPSQLNGESGYYLTVYESAIEYINTHLSDDLVEIQPEIEDFRREFELDDEVYGDDENIERGSVSGANTNSVALPTEDNSERPQSEIEVPEMHSETSGVDAAVRDDQSHSQLDESSQINLAQIKYSDDIPPATSVSDGTQHQVDAELSDELSEKQK